jgi:hypothetical protein
VSNGSKNFPALSEIAVPAFVPRSLTIAFEIGVLELACRTFPLIVDGGAGVGFVTTGSVGFSLQPPYNSSAAIDILNKCLRKFITYSLGKIPVFIKINIELISDLCF